MHRKKLIICLISVRILILHAIFFFKIFTWSDVNLINDRLITTTTTIIIKIILQLLKFEAWLIIPNVALLISF